MDKFNTQVLQIAKKAIRSPEQIKTIYELMDRVIYPGFHEYFCVEPTDNTEDEFYRIYWQAGNIHILASSVSAACAGFYAYCKSFLKCEIGPITRHVPVEVGSRPPAFQGVIEKHTHFPVRYFLNYCTYGYTMAFWQWEDYERLIDWMALSGINLALSIVGHEEVVRRLLAKYGYSDPEIAEYSKSVIWQLKDGTIEPIARKYLYACTDLEIVTAFNSELRGICNYYALASNFNKLSYFAYLMEYSCLKTIAGKHKSTSRKIVGKYQDGNGNWSIPYKTAKGEKRRGFANFMDCKNTDSFHEVIIDYAVLYASTRTTFDDRLSARVCELCGRTDVPLEIHHVNKVKNLKGKEFWEQMMIAKKRKTIAVCKACHYQIHNPCILLIKL